MIDVGDSAPGSSLTISMCGTSTRWDSALYVGVGCPNNASSWNLLYYDNDGCGVSGGLSRIFMATVPSRILYVMVTANPQLSRAATTYGIYTLTWTVTPPTPSLTPSPTIDGGVGGGGGGGVNADGSVDGGGGGGGSPNSGTTAGIVIGVILAVVVGVVAAVLTLKRRRAAFSPQRMHDNPNVDEGGPPSTPPPSGSYSVSALLGAFTAAASARVVSMADAYSAAIRSYTHGVPPSSSAASSASSSAPHAELQSARAVTMADAYSAAARGYTHGVPPSSSSAASSSSASTSAPRAQFQGSIRTGGGNNSGSGGVSTNSNGGGSSQQPRGSFIDNNGRAVNAASIARARMLQPLSMGEEEYPVYTSALYSHGSGNNTGSSGGATSATAPNAAPLAAPIRQLPAGPLSVRHHGGRSKYITLPILFSPAIR